MRIVICPGIHSLTLTQDFLMAFGARLVNALVIPAGTCPVYSPTHVLEFLVETLGHPGPGTVARETAMAQPLLFLGFSAGVVGSIGAARAWQQQGGTVRALIALDGWGVPLYADFPIHRVSHDYFTHWSSALLGSGQDSFYADPPVEHLELWRSPQTVQGYWLLSGANSPTGTLQTSSNQGLRATVAQFLIALLDRYSDTAAP